MEVTDELFDEIATKVLDEDDLIIEGNHAITSGSLSMAMHLSLTTNVC
jgi:hypothetical protein